jgi:hypothetical protein
MSEQAKHTPGPWKFRLRSKDGIGTYSNDIRVYYDGGDGSDWVADVGCELDPVRHANARLIAAAPELLVACQFFDKYARMQESKGNALPSQLVDSVRAAIAKAGGAA